MPVAEFVEPPLQTGLCCSGSKICVRRRQNPDGGAFHEALDDGFSLGAGAAERPELVQPVASWAVWPLLEADGQAPRTAMIVSGWGNSEERSAGGMYYVIW